MLDHINKARFQKNCHSNVAGLSWVFHDDLLFFAATDKKDDNSVSADDDGYDHNDSPLAIEQKLKEESTARMDRLVHVVGKMREMRDQRRMLIGRLREEMEKEDAEDAQSGQLPAQDDVDLLRELGNGRVSAADAASAKRRLDARYGELVSIDGRE